MAYKFQIGDSIVSGSLTRDAGDVKVRNHGGVERVSLLGNGVVSGSGQAAFASIDTDGEVDAGSYEIGGVSVINASKQLQNIASLDSTTETTIETAIDTLANLASAGTLGNELNFLGSIDTTQGLLVNNVSTITPGRAIQNVAAYSGSGTITGPSFAADGALTLGGNAVVAALSASAASSVLSLGINGAAQIASTGIGTLASLSIGGQSVIDSSRNAVKFANVSGSGDGSFLGQLKAGNSGFQVDADGDTIVKSLDVNSGGITEAGAISGATSISGSGALSAGGTVRFDGVANDTIAVAADSFYFLDNDSKLVKKQAVGNVVAALAGAGLVETSDQFAVSLGSNGGLVILGDSVEISGSNILAGVAAVATEQMLFLNSDGTLAKESFLDYAAAIAGGGLTATNGVLSTQGGTVTPISDLGTLAEGYNYLTGAAGGSYKLPIDASVGDVVHLKNGAGGVATLTRQSNHTIDGLNSIVLESSRGAVSMVYAVTSSWFLV
tara:strand:+ start:1205 stop:2695 length:1491 start_codon:yes stop_codon:yes gene_type:complete